MRHQLGAPCAASLENIRPQELSPHYPAFCHNQACPKPVGWGPDLTSLPITAAAHTAVALKGRPRTSEQQEQQVHPPLLQGGLHSRPRLPCASLGPSVDGVAANSACCEN